MYTKVKKNRTPEEKFEDFHGYPVTNVREENICIPDKVVDLGVATNIIYKSDKWDGKERIYDHKLKKQGRIYADPDGKMIIIVGLNLNIKPEGLTG